MDNPPPTIIPAVPTQSGPGITRTPYLRDLNPAQRSAVEAIDGPLLVLAGAGTGKTKVLTARLAHLLVTGAAFPGHIMAVTFTNKAAWEMKARVNTVLSDRISGLQGLWIGTFHAIGARILRRHAEMVGLTANFTILDTDDQLRLVKQIIRDANIDTERWPARTLLAIFQRWKDRGLTPDQLSATAVETTEGHDRATEKWIRTIYAEYAQRLIALNACDFGDLLLHCLTLFHDQTLLREYQNRFKYLLVDEYQDTNIAQYLWLRLLAQGHSNICCVGDDDQSIYGWRGAEVGNILRFEKDFPGARVVRLEQNYRSTGHILAAASAIIAHNKTRLGKALWTQADAGEQLTLYGFSGGAEEASYIATRIEDRARDVSYDDMAVLVRTTAQMREFEEAFGRACLPYRVIGGLRFYERREIRDALAYLRIIHQPADNLAFERIINLPRRGIGAATIQALRTYARHHSVSLIEAGHQMLAAGQLRGTAKNGLTQLLQNRDSWAAEARTSAVDILVQHVLEESGYANMWRQDNSIEAAGRCETLAELINAVGEFTTLGGFLEHVSLVMEANQDDGQPKITLSTLHGAKGLEFDTVFLPAWEDGLFPNSRAINENIKDGGGEEEERRLAYVGITRARRRAEISFAAARRLHGQWQSAIPSRFIAELPRTAVTITSDATLYRATSFGHRGRMLPQYESRPVIEQEEATPPPARPVRLSPLIIDNGGGNSSATVAPRSARQQGFKTGNRVFHQKFGYGTIERVEGENLCIIFDKSDAKMVKAGFVAMADAAGSIG